MTDDAELIARLRKVAQLITKKPDNFRADAELLNTAADALEQRTRTITALQGQLAEARKAEDEWVAIAAQNAKDATQRTRAAEATTWEEAADMICHNRKDGSVLYNQVEEMRRRAHAARAGEMPTKPFVSGGCLDHD